MENKCSWTVDKYDYSSPILYTNMECWDFDNEKNFHDGLD